ncbi:MAG: 30S ribosomal protein S6 [bacterium]
MQKKFYESYIIIDGNLEDAAIEEEIKKYESFFSKNEVEIVLVNRMGRKRLAYPINKKLNGFYVCFEIHSSPELISKIERTYKLDENILRYLTIFVSPKTKTEKEEHFKNKAILQSKYDEAKEKLELSNAAAKEAAEAKPVEETVKSTTPVKEPVKEAVVK